jgi:hypothetical protein
MTVADIEFRVHLKWGEVLLAETASFQPSEKDEEVYRAFVALIQQSVGGLESLWDKWEKQFERSGISIEEAGSIARSLKHGVYVFERCLDMIGTCRGGQSAAVEEEARARLAKLGEKAQPLLRIVNLPLPEFAPERAQRGMEEVERGGIDAEEWLSQLTQDGER